MVETGVPISVFGCQTSLVLTPQAIQWLAEFYPSLIPDISEDSLEDRNKADSLAKALLVLQVSYFCMSCILRRIKSLPLSLLEITTFAHALCTLMTYAIWWKKPMNIAKPTVITGMTEIVAFLLAASESFRPGYGGVGTRTSGSNELRNLYISQEIPPSGSVIHHLDDLQETLNIYPGESVKFKGLEVYFYVKRWEPSDGTVTFYSSGRSKVPWYGTVSSESFGLTRLSRKDLLRWRYIGLAIQNYGTGCSQLRGRTCFADTDASFHSSCVNMETVSCAPPIIKVFLCTGCVAFYGVPHIMAWNSHFPTFIESHLWKAATLGLTFMAFPITAMLLLAWNTALKYRSRLMKILETMAGQYTRCGYIIYLFTSGFIIVESIRQLFFLPASVFVQLSISNIWPHIS